MTADENIPAEARFIVVAAAVQRFGHYGVRSLLLLFLTNRWHLTDTVAGQIYGCFYGSLFVTALIGGYIGDKSRNYIWAGSLGLVLIAAGQVGLAIGVGIVSVCALIVYSIGFGIFDTNMNAAIAGQFREDQRLREAAYTVLYTSINVGAMLGPLICGFVALRASYGYAFVVAGVSTVGAIWCYNRASEINYKARVVNSDEGAECASKSSAVATIVALGLLGVVFWAVFDQLGSSVTLLAQRYAQRRFGRFEIPAGYVQSINPLLVIVLGPVFSFFIIRGNMGPGDTKVRSRALIGGLLLLATGFGLLAYGTRGATADHQDVGWMWILLAILFSTIGELLFAPVSLSLVGGLAPGKHRSLILGAWSATFGVGAYLSGVMAGSMHAFRSLAAFFSTSSAACVIIGVIFLAVLKVGRKSAPEARGVAGSR